MANQTVVLTVLPQGTNGAARRFSVHVAPRLVPPNPAQRTLSAVPSFLEWPLHVPTRVSLAQYNAAVGGGLQLAGPHAVADRISPDPDLSLWQALFHGTMPIEPFNSAAFSGKFAASKFRSFPTMALHEFQMKMLRELVVSHSTNAPTLADATNIVGGLCDLHVRDVRKKASIDIEAAFGVLGPSNRFRTTPGRLHRPGAASPHPEMLDHLQLLNFLRPRTSAAYIAAHAPQVPVIDFHRAMALLADHPALLRRLGLVVDFEIPGPAFAAANSFATASRVRLVAATWGNVADVTFAAPFTAVQLAPFLAARKPNGRLTNSRMVDLTKVGKVETDDGWNVISLDVEGTAIKTVALAHKVNEIANLPSNSPSVPSEIDTPAPRQGGLSLVRTGRAKDTSTDFAATADLLANNPDTVQLYLDDLVRGARVDVYDETTSTWNSLTKRDLTYIVAGSTGPMVITAPDDPTLDTTPGTTARLYSNEGVITNALTSNADPTAVAPDMHVQEGVVEWSGWSLVAPRPGKSLPKDPNSVTPVAAPDPTHPDLGITIAASATPRSLPRLRFGRRYRFRLRTADLAGCGPTLTSAGGLPTSGAPSVAEYYSRFEPVPPPVVVPAAPFTEGESLLTLVLRSFDETTPLADVPSNVRYLLPPSATAATAELHGALDTLTETTAYTVLTSRDGQHLGIGVGPAPGVPGSAYEGLPEPGSNQTQPTPFFPNLVEVPPWLIDPVVSGLRIGGPGGREVTGSFTPATVGEWYNARSWTLALVADHKDAGFSVRATTLSRSIELAVGKGEQYKVRLSSQVQAAMQQHLAGWHLLGSAGLKPDALLAMQADLIAGRNRQVTPPTFLRLVHAVKIPLISPRFAAGSVTQQRDAGSTWAKISGNIIHHPPSTSRLDVHLAWNDWLDTAPSGATTSPGAATLPPVNVTYPAGSNPGSTATGQIRHEFGDTKHRLVTLTATGTSRYASYFTRTTSLVIGPLAQSLLADGETGIQEHTERVVGPDGVVLTRGKHYVIDYAAGTIRNIGINLAVRRVAVRFVPLPITRTTDAGSEAQIHVLSSASPAAPVVRDVVQVFDDTDWIAYPSLGPRTGSQRTRDGRTLRVYLDRPWYSSGEGEMLGVVLDRSAGVDVSGQYRGVVYEGLPGSSPRQRGQLFTTAWGRDPLVVGSAASTSLTMNNFPRAAGPSKWITGMPVPGFSGPVVVVPHAVEFDPVRKLWFSDITVRLGLAYRPFIRLALVRYQPYSLPGKHLSPVAMTDTVQFGVKRTMVVTGDGTTRTVSLSGPGYSAADTVPPPGSANGLSYTDADARIFFAPGPLLVAKVQARHPNGSLTGVDPEFGWFDLPGRSYTLAKTANPDAQGNTIWLASGVNVTVNPGYQARIVVREFERDTRPENAAGIAAASSQRLAFADTFVV